jgi:hypothetical protein
MSGAGAGAGGVRSRSVFEAGASNSALLPPAPEAPRIPDSVVGTWVDLAEMGGRHLETAFTDIPTMQVLMRTSGMLDGKSADYGQLTMALSRAETERDFGVDDDTTTYEQRDAKVKAAMANRHKYAGTDIGKQEKRIFNEAVVFGYPAAIAEAALLRRRHLLTARALQRAADRKAGIAIER